MQARVRQAVSEITAFDLPSADWLISSPSEEASLGSSRVALPAQGWKACEISSKKRATNVDTIIFIAEE